jgi:3-oxoacyl-[acyl-carrier protein] reductase
MIPLVRLSPALFLLSPESFFAFLLNPIRPFANQLHSRRIVERRTFRTWSRKMSNLKGKVALVTGASKGIGAAIARELAAHGAAVAVNYSSSQAEAEKVVGEIKAAGGKAIPVKANVADPKSIEPLIETVARELGPINVLVNNAGVYEFGPIDTVTPESFHKQFNLNVLGLILTTQSALRHFHPEGGSIINIGSVVASGIAAAAVYAGTKGAVNSVTVSLSKELGPRKIRVNALNPGMVETEGVHAAGFFGSDFQKQAEAETPLGRIGQPKDIAGVAAFLASDESYWLTGQTIQASGGARL